MRATTAAELAVFTGKRAVNAQHHVKVEVQDAAGVWRDWTNLDGEWDVIVDVSMQKALRDGVWTGAVQFVWLRYNDNLTPFGDPQGRFHGYVDMWRRVRISVKVIPPDAEPSLFDWNEMVDGRITNYDVSNNPGSLEFIGRLVGEAQRNSFITRLREFGDNDGTKDVEDVVQDLATSWWSPQWTAPTISVPAASSIQVKQYYQQKMPLWDAMRAVASQIGWLIEERWDDTGGAFELELYEPARTQTSPDITIEPEQVVSYGSLGLNEDTIRNAVEVIYGSGSETDEARNDLRTREVRTAATTPAHTLLEEGGTPVAGSSIAKYGQRFMGIIEAATSLIVSPAQASALADAALADLADPTLVFDVRLPWALWPAQLNDLVRLKADGQRTRADIEGAIQKIRLQFNESGGSTTLTLKGKPGIPKEMWLANEGRPGVALPSNVDPRDPPALELEVVGGQSFLYIQNPNHWDYDQILWHRATYPNFTPTQDTLWKLSRETRVQVPIANVIGQPYYYKVQIRDAQGNIGEGSNSRQGYAIDYTSIPTFTPSVYFADTGDGSEIPSRTLDSAMNPFGEQQTQTSNYEAATDERWCAPADGVYQVMGVFQADAEPSASTLQLEWYNVDAAATVVTGTPNGTAGGGGGAPALPYVVDATRTASTSGTTHTPNYPTTVDDGDLLIAVADCNANAGTFGAPSGWTILGQGSDATNAESFVIAARSADGTEDGGTTGNFTTTNSVTLDWTMLRIKSWRDSGTLTDDVLLGEFDPYLEGTGTTYNFSLVRLPDDENDGALFLAVSTNESGLASGLGSYFWFADWEEDPSWSAGNTGFATWYEKAARQRTAQPPPIEGGGDSYQCTIAVLPPAATGGASTNGTSFLILGTFLADEGDCFELRMGGTGTVGTFNLTGSLSITPVDVVTGVSRSDPYVPQATPAGAAWIASARTTDADRTTEITDVVVRNNKALTAGQRIALRGVTGEGEVCEWGSNDSAGLGYTRPVATATRTTDAVDSQFTAVAFDQATGERYAAGHTYDAAGDYAFVIRYSSAPTPAEVSDVTLSTLGTRGEIPHGLRVRSSDTTAFVATQRAGSGRVYRVDMQSATPAIEETGPAVAELFGLCLLEGATDRVVVVSASSLLCYGSEDLATQLWSTALPGTFDRAERGRIVETKDGSGVYVALGGGITSALGASNLYRYNSSGTLVWSLDLDGQTPLGTIDGVGAISVDAYTGDVWAVVWNYNNGWPLWDVVQVSPNGVFLGSMRTDHTDPQYYSEVQLTEEHAGVPVGLHRFSNRLVVYHRGGFANTWRAIEFEGLADLGELFGVTFHELDLSSFTDGDTPSAVTLKDTSGNGRDIVLAAPSGQEGEYLAAGGIAAAPCIKLVGSFLNADQYEQIDDLSDFDLTKPIGVLAYAYNSRTNPGSHKIAEIRSASHTSSPWDFSWALYSSGFSFPSTGVYQEVWRPWGPRYIYNYDDTFSQKPVLIGDFAGIEQHGNYVAGQWGGAQNNDTEPDYFEWTEGTYVLFEASVFKGSDTDWNVFYPMKVSPPVDVASGAGALTNIGTPTVLETQMIEGSWTAMDFDSGDGLNLGDNYDYTLAFIPDGHIFGYAFSIWIEWDTAPTGDVLIAQKLDATTGWHVFWDHSELRFRFEYTWGLGGLAANGPAFDSVPTGAIHLGWQCTGQEQAGASTDEDITLKVWTNGIPGTPTTFEGGTVVDNASDCRFFATDGNTPGGIGNFVGKATCLGVWSETNGAAISDLSMYSLWRLGVAGYSVELTPDPANHTHLDATADLPLRDWKLTLGGDTQFSDPTYLYGFWVVSLNGETKADRGLLGQLGQILSQYLGAAADFESRTPFNDPRFGRCFQSYAWARMFDASGNITNDVWNWGPTYKGNQFTAVSVAAYEQDGPDILGANNIPQLLVDDPLLKYTTDAGTAWGESKAITMDDNATLTLAWPDVYWTHRAWAISWMHKWDTASAHSKGTIFSMDFATTGDLRISIQGNDVVVEADDGTVTTTHTVNVGTSLMDGSWHALQVAFSSGLNGALIDIKVYHAAGPDEAWNALVDETADVLDPTDYNDLSAASVVFGASAVVTAGEEFEGDLSHVRVAIGGGNVDRLSW